MRTTKQEQERWCVTQWLECRREMGLGGLKEEHELPLGFRADFLFTLGSEKVGVEVTRIIDGGLAAAEEAAWSFIANDLAPRLDGRLPGLVFAHPTLRKPWVLRQQDRIFLAHSMAARILDESMMLKPGGATVDVSSPPNAYLRISRGSKPDSRLALGATWAGVGWQGDFDAANVERIVSAVHNKATAQQLRHATVTTRVLLLHDRNSGVSEDSARRALARCDETDLREFDEITLVSTYEPGRCVQLLP